MIVRSSQITNSVSESYPNQGWCLLPFQAALFELDKSVDLVHFLLTELSDSDRLDKFVQQLKQIYSQDKVRQNFLGPIMWKEDKLSSSKKPGERKPTHLTATNRCI